MDRLNYSVNGVDYLLMEIYVSGKNHKEVDATLKKYNVICQGIKEIKFNFLFRNYCILKVLVPEFNVVDFDNEI